MSTPFGSGPQHDADLLTGLPSARAWPRLLADHRRRNPDRSWVAVLRLDDFAAYANTHGGAAADLLLVDVAAAWEAALRSGDVIARFEGADFGCALRAAEMSSAFTVVARLRRHLPDGITCSAAIAQPDAGETGVEVTHRAWDGVRAAASRGGANRIAVLLPGSAAA